MKKSISKALALLTIFTIACAKNTLVENSPIVNNSDTITEISITGKDFQFEGDTRSSVSVSESGVSFLWDEDDVIGIFPDKGDQVSFAMEQGAGTQTATFTGGGWALKSSATYAAYYPHVYENRDLTKIPVSYLGQTQNGNANTDHIGAYDFMAASVTTPSNGAVAFDMQHLGALVQLTLAIPEPSILNRLVLSSSVKLTKTGIIDLTSETPSIVSEIQSNTLDIVLNDISTTVANENVTIYFMMAPVDLTGSEFAASIYFEDGTAFGFEIAGKIIEAGRAYKFSIGTEDVTPNEKVSIPNNQVWVTTTDGTFSTNGDAFGAQIVSINNVDGMCVVTFDRDITTIGDFAFSNCTTLESIVLPNSVKEIKKYAFNDCSGLKKITLGSGLCSVGDYAFSGCTGELFVNSDITGRWFNLSKFTKVTMGDNVVHIGNDAFNSLIIEDIIWGKNVETIGVRAFCVCSKISNIIIPETVKSIGENAFSYCSGLENLTISDSVTTIGNEAFKSCTNLTNIAIGCNVTSIGDYAFEGCNIIELEIPCNVKSIGGRAFQGCSNLKSAIICNTIQESDSSTTTIGGSAFSGCSSLESVAIYNGVKTIQANAFCRCEKIKSITIPESVTSIEKEAFYLCDSLANVYCKPVTPPTLGSSAFSFNASGRKIYVPRNSVNAYKAANYWSNYSSSIEGYDF